LRVIDIAKALIALLRERWVVRIKGRPDLEVKENILDHEYNTKVCFGDAVIL